jgi:hypothetical protein
LRDQEQGVRVWVALQAMILSFGAAELTNTGNRASKGTTSDWVIGSGGSNLMRRLVKAQPNKCARLCRSVQI